MDAAVAAPILDGRTVGVAQNIIVSDLRFRNRIIGKVEPGLPEFRVEIVERNRLHCPAIAEQFVVAGEKKRLARLGCENAVEK